MENEPNAENPADHVFEKAGKQLGESIERNIERGSRTAAHLDRTLISLSAGALVLSMTFVGTLAPKKPLLFVLFSSWGCFAAAMVLVIFAMRSEQKAIITAVNNASGYLKRLEEDKSLEVLAMMGVSPVVQKRVNTNNTVAALNTWALAAFIVGVVLLGTFVGYNLWQKASVRCPLRAANEIS
jgi:hypothetical protein